MAHRLTASDVRQSLRQHAAAAGAEIHARYGPQIGWPQLLRMLEDRTCVRYPCRVAFDREALQAGECAHPVALGPKPEEGFTMWVHPFFTTRLEDLPALVLYQLVRVNYGAFASSEDAEVFGAAALGISTDDYYQRLCQLHDLVDCQDRL